MNRTKQLGLSLLALLCYIYAAAQSSVTKGEYWFDQQFDSRQTITLTGGVWDAQLDLSDMTPGLHRLAIRSGTNDGRWSAVMVKHFLVPQVSSTQENTLSKYEYWIDREFDKRVSGSFAADGVLDLDLDMASLSPGLHNISVRALDGNGNVSPVVVRHFLIPEEGSLNPNGLTTYRYWFDHNLDNAVEGTIAEGGLIDIDIELPDLDPGLHELNYQVKDEQGHYSATMVKFFEILEGVDAEGNIIVPQIVSYEYWFDDHPRKKVEVEPTTTLELNDVMLAVEGIEPKTVPADYTFDVENKKVIITQNVEFGLQVFNNLGIGSEAVKQAIDNYEISVDPLFVELTNEVGDTKVAPKGGQIQGFSYTGAVGDSLHWEITNEVGAEVDFYDDNGNAITPETKTIDEKDVLVMKMPTESVYALAYGATQDGDITIKVAQPVELAVNDATREYGEENPTFTYSIKGAAVDGEVAFTTEATAASGVGEYTVSIDGSGITNSYVTLKFGTLTITKAKLTITADDIEVHQDEEMPVLTWKAEGWKNGDDESVLTMQPVCATEGKPDSPLGDYAITISGAEAANYDITYVDGKLTVSLPVGIASFSANIAPADIYTLQGIKVRSKAETLDGLTEGYYIVNRRKVFIRRR